MEFFNKKEEVIDLKLTQFGRFLLSKGKFKPVYYSFFDDNILYNSSKAGFSEDQNESEKRITDETPTMHHQVSFSSLEKQFRTNYNKILSGEESAVSEDLQRTAEKHYALPQPIGTSDINSEYSPSWTARYLNGKLTGSIQYLNLAEKSGGKNTQVVPQLETHLKIEVFNLSSQNDDEEEMEDGFADSNIVVTSAEDDLFILLKLSESNGFFQKKNFDIEIFEIEEEEQNGTIIETLRPLNFSLEPHATSEVSFVDEETPDTNVTQVEYYFDLLTDNEIDEETLCNYDPTNKKMGVFSDPRTKLCQDIINQQKKQVFDIYSDESDNPGEIC
tara:strand:+ start:269 stop:1261 length:993 start_codon:yes stop_codon:yes gene_type:complete